MVSNKGGTFSIRHYAGCSPWRKSLRKPVVKQAAQSSPRRSLIEAGRNAGSKGRNIEESIVEVNEDEGKKSSDIIMPQYSRLSENSDWSCNDCGTDSTCEVCSQFVERTVLDPLEVAWREIETAVKSALEHIPLLHDKAIVVAKPVIKSKSSIRKLKKYALIDLGM